MEDIEHHDIPIYNFPYDVEEDDEDTIQENMELRVICISSSRRNVSDAPKVHAALRGDWIRRGNRT